ncbi:hypothetical protein GTW59_15120, partial [Streptomyces sp. SID89]|nr:hypothetical protein [Streptomyces sp. SID89]
MTVDGPVVLAGPVGREKGTAAQDGLGGGDHAVRADAAGGELVAVAARPGGERVA